MKRLLSALCALSLAGCATTGVKMYKAEQPKLDLPVYLNGQIDAWGIFQDRSGEVTKRFHVLIDAQWSGDQGGLDEQFSWSDGSSSRRVWHLSRQADGTYRGKADDVVGEAHEAQADGDEEGVDGPA